MGLAQAPVAAPAAGAAPMVVVRDERLDEYLRAHQAARGGVAVAAPGAALRRVEMTVPATPSR
jgi:sigma-E factor negative regulatory protein RseA